MTPRRGRALAAGLEPIFLIAAKAPSAVAVKVAADAGSSQRP